MNSSKNLSQLKKTLRNVFLYMYVVVVINVILSVLVVQLENLHMPAYLLGLSTNQDRHRFTAGAKVPKKNVYDRNNRD